MGPSLFQGHFFTAHIMDWPGVSQSPEDKIVNPKRKRLYKRGKAAKRKRYQMKPKSTMYMRPAAC